MVTLASRPEAHSALNAGSVAYEEQYEAPQTDCDLRPTFVGGNEIPIESGLEVRKGQIEGIRIMQKRKRFLNRDKPGTGKTFQGVYASVGPTMCCVPAHLAQQWYEWLAGQPDPNKPNHHRPYHPVGKGNIIWVQGDWYEKQALFEKAMETHCDFLIFNIECLSTHAETLKAMAEDTYFRTLILDESHRLRGHQSTRAKEARELGKWFEYVYELTATPIWKEVDDLFMQLSILQPDIFTSWYEFVDHFCISDKDRWSTKVLGVKKDVIPELDEMLEIISIGRTSAEMGYPLPKAVKHYRKVKFPKPLLNAYNDMKKSYALQLMGEEIRFDNYSQIMRMLRLLTACPIKIDAVKDIIEDINPKETIVVFTWFRESCEAVAKALGGVALHGGIKSPTSKVTDQAYRRQLALGSRIVVATIGALAEGVDLSHARTLIYFEEHYAPGAEEQSSSRVVRDRKGHNNEEPVQVYYVHVEDTIDEAIHKVAQGRAGSAKEVLGLTLGLQL